MAKRKASARQAEVDAKRAKEIAEAKAAFTAKRNRLLRLQLRMLDQQQINAAVYPYKFVHVTATKGRLGSTDEPWIHYVLLFETWHSIPKFDGSDPCSEELIDALQDPLVRGEQLTNYVGTDSPDYVLSSLEDYLNEVEVAIAAEAEKIERKANALKKARDLLAPEELAALGLPSS